MTYNVFIKRASSRMLGLREKLKDAPFLKEQGIDGERFIEPLTSRQINMNFSTPATN
jgi:hypothetical protein